MEQTDIIKRKYLILQEITSAIVLKDNIREIADLILELSMTYAHAEKGSLMLLSDQDELSIFASQGLDHQFANSYKVALGDGIAGVVAKDRSPVLVEDIENHNNFRELRRDHYRTRSFISCPIISKNKLLGVLNINDKHDGSPFNTDEFELTKILANYAAIALENAFLMSQLKSKAKEFEDINKKLVDTDILKTEFLTRISHELRTPLNSLKGAIYFLQNAENKAQSEQREFQAIISSEIDSLVSTVENLLNFLRLEEKTRSIKRTVLNMQEIFNEIQSSTLVKTFLARRGIQLTMETSADLLDIVGDKIKVVQLFTNLLDSLSYYLERGNAIHIVTAENEQVTVTISLSQALPESVLPILYDNRFIFQSEPSEDHLKLYLAKNIAETHQWKFTTYNADNIGYVVLTIPKTTKEAIDCYVDRILDSLVEFISELLDLDICSIMLSDEMARELTVKSAIGLDEAIIKKTRIKYGDKISGWVAQEGRPLFIENVENDPRFAIKSIAQYTTKSLMSLPLKIGSRVIGVLNLNNKKTAATFTKWDYWTAAMLSEKISQLIELLYSDNYREEDLRQIVASFGALLTADKLSLGKKDLFPTLTDKILRDSSSLRKINTTPT
jgi:GAF domain-containing protein